MRLDPPHSAFNNPNMYEDRRALHLFKIDSSVGVILVVQDLAGEYVGKSVSCKNCEVVSGSWEGLKLKLEDV
jgi:hypothetical protein